MTDLEISKALALAIGWHQALLSPLGILVQTYNPGDRVKVGQWRWGWRVFDYRDWNVIGPIAQRYDAFPMKSRDDGEWHSFFEGNDTSLGYADTPQKAIALAVIVSKK